MLPVYFFIASLMVYRLFKNIFKKLSKKDFQHKTLFIDDDLRLILVMNNEKKTEEIFIFVSSLFVKLCTDIYKYIYIYVLT